MTIGIFDNTIALLGSSLGLRADRHKLLTSNIANQETPGYRAVDISFEEELSRGRGGLGTSGVYLAATSPGHITAGSRTRPEPRVLDRATDLPGLDSNSVGIEAEMARLSENTLMYSISSKMLKSKLNILATAIREGGR